MIAETETPRSERLDWISRLSKAIGFIGTALPAFIVLIIMYEVTLRYLFNQPTLWVNEASLWMCGIMFLLTGPYTMQQRNHIRITILPTMVARPVKLIFATVSTALIVVFAVAVIWGGYDEALRKLMGWERFGTAWNPPIPATLKPLVLITVALTALQAVVNLILDFKGRSGDHVI